MLESPVISVIVAVYQSEKYMRRCLDSIRGQSFSDFEVIMVDDGSRDKSGVICDEYAKLDVRFRAIHKKHEGVSSARQTGLDAANGEYIIHADPDNWVEPNWLENLFGKLKENEADIVICDFERVFNTRSVYRCQKPRSFNNDDILADLLEERIWGCCWNKLVKRSLFNHYRIDFNASMCLWEDLYVTCLLILNGARVTYLPEMLYHYDATVNNNSILRALPYEDKIRSITHFVEELSPSLTSAIFDDGWYHVKAKVKDLLFLSNKRSSSIRNTYPEINQRYIKESRNCSWKSLEYSVGLCLSGHFFFAHALYSFVASARAIKSTLLSVVRSYV